MMRMQQLLRQRAKAREQKCLSQIHLHTIRFNLLNTPQAKILLSKHETIPSSVMLVDKRGTKLCLGVRAQ